MATDARANFAGTVVDKGAFGLHGKVVCVQRLQDDVRIGRHHEVGRAVGVYRHDAVLNLEAQVRVFGNDDVLLVVFVTVALALCGPRPRHLF